MLLFAKYWALCIAWSSKVQPSHSQTDIHVGKVHIKSINNLEAQLSDDIRIRSRVLICALIPVTSDRVVVWAMWAATLHSMLGEHIVTVSAIINAGDDDHSYVVAFLLFVSSAQSLFEAGILYWRFPNLLTSQTSDRWEPRLDLGTSDSGICIHPFPWLFPLLYDN